MNLALQKIRNSKIEELEKEIHLHRAWHGYLNGVDCEDYLRGQPVFSYILRAGEERFHYYLSFVIENSFLFKHQPFKIDPSKHGWLYRNLTERCTSNIEELIPMIMHCESTQCLPLIRLK